MILLFTDVIVIESNQNTNRNVFKELNRQYTGLVRCKENNFLRNITATPMTRADPERTFTMEMVLLPHQIFIMPAIYLQYLQAHQTFLLINILNNDQLRYNYFALKQRKRNK